MFKDRTDAGIQLSEKLAAFRTEKCIVYGLPRGGIPVAYEIAQKLRKPLEALIVKKIGMPGQEELALGAVAEGDPPAFYFNMDLMYQMHVEREYLQPLIDRKLNDIKEMQYLYRGSGALLLNKDSVAIVVDDGVATGATLKAAVNLLRSIGQKKIVVAVPAGQKNVLDEIRKMTDDLICLNTVRTLYAVGEFYEDFSQVEHDTVIQMLRNMEEQLKSSKVSD